MKRAAVVGIVGGVAALALAATGVWWFMSRPPTAEAAAESYLRALETGDFAAVAALGGDDAEGEDSTVAQAFTSAASYISDVEVVEVRAADGSASVQAEALFGDERRVLSFTMQDSGDGWRSIGLVVGATVDRAAFGLTDDLLEGMPLLAPGFGHQGARLADCSALFGALTPHVLASASRSILSAGPDGLVEAISNHHSELEA